MKAERGAKEQVNSSALAFFKTFVQPCVSKSF